MQSPMGHLLGSQLFPGVFGSLRVSEPDWLPHLRAEGGEKSEE